MEVSKEAGLSCPLWGTSACFFDYDRDGWLDLVVNYVAYDPSWPCTEARGERDFCHPRVFQGTVTRLFHNVTGQGKAAGKSMARFEDVTVSSGLLRRCLEKEPRLVRAHYYLSLALFGQGEALKQQAGRQADSMEKFKEAARWARRATELDPRHGEAHFQLGLTLMCLGDRAEAITAFRQAVATRPDLADAHLWLGKALLEDGKKEPAIAHLRDAVRYAAPNDPRPQRALEEVLGATKP